MAFTVAKTEWDTAHYYLDKKPDGTKLTYSATSSAQGFLLPRKNKNQLYWAIEKHNGKNPANQLEQTTHSFVVLAGKIYALAQGKTPAAVLGQGSFGKVKYLVDENQQVFVLKKEKMMEDGDEVSLSELSVLQDRNMSTGRHQARHLEHAQDDMQSDIFYTQMEDAGISLEKITRRADLTDEERLDIGIDVCLEVDDFHYIRRKSKSKTANAHLDLKLPNITRDKQGKVHLIDFGFAVSNPANIPLITGTPLYVPKETFAGRKRTLTGEQFDIFALKRCLFMPDELWCHDEHVDNARAKYPEHPGILSPKIMNDYPEVNKYVNTGSKSYEQKYYNNDSISACALAAILIATKLDLSISADILATDWQKARFVTGIYSADPLRAKTRIEESLSDEKSIGIIAAFSEMDHYERMEDFMADEQFASTMMAAKFHEKACACILLKSLNLTELYASLDNAEIVRALYALWRQPKNIWTKENIGVVAKRPVLAALLNILEKEQLQEHFQTLLASPVLYTFFTPLDRKDEEKDLLLFLLKNNFSAESLVEIFQNKTLYAALILLRKQGFSSTETLLQVIKNPVLAQAILDLSSYKDTWCYDAIYYLIKADPKIWKAVSLYKDAQEKPMEIMKSPAFIADLSTSYYNSAISIQTAEAIAYLAEKGLTEFIHEKIPGKAVCALAAIEEPGFDNKDIRQMLTNPEVIKKLSKSGNPEHTKAIIILFKQNLLKDNFATAITMRPGFAKSIIFLEKDPWLLAQFLNPDSGTSQLVSCLFARNKGMVLIPALLQSDIIPGEEAMIGVLTALGNEPSHITYNLIQALSNRIDKVFSSESHLARALTGINDRNSRLLLLRSLSGEKLITFIVDFPAFAARLNNSTIAEEVKCVLLEAKLQNHIANKDGLLISGLKSVLTLGHTDGKSFQNACIRALRDTEDSHNEGADIYKLLLDETAEDQDIYKAYVAKVSEQSRQDNQAASLWHFSLRSIGTLAIAAATFALFLIPGIGQLSLAGMLSIALVAGTVFLAMTYVPKIWQSMQSFFSETEQVDPCIPEDISDKAFNKGPQAMHALGGSLTKSAQTPQDSYPKSNLQVVSRLDAPCLKATEALMFQDSGDNHADRSFGR